MPLEKSKPNYQILMTLSMKKAGTTMLSQSTIPFQDFKQQQSSIAGSEYIKFPLASVEPEAFGSFRVRNPDS